jgi:hypothetical protein
MDIGVPGLLALYYILWICVPIIPAVVIYALFPRDPINVRGPLGALTINAGGAFAAYVIVFGLAFPIVKNAEDALGGMMSPTWTVSAKVKLLDGSGKEADKQLLQGLSVQLRPDYYTTANELVTVQIPEIGSRLPKVILSIPKFGSQVLDLDDANDITKDDFHKTIKVNNAITIQQIPILGVGLAVTKASEVSPKPTP